MATQFMTRHRGLTSFTVLVLLAIHIDPVHALDGRGITDVLFAVSLSGGIDGVDISQSMDEPEETGAPAG